MLKVNRESAEDARRIVDGFIENESIKYQALSFLSNAIIYAHSLNQRNWNLNLDKNGGFVRFNVGHEYCIEIFKGYVSVLVLKEYMEKILRNVHLEIEFKGYTGKQKVITNNLESTPDCLIKVPGSVACHVKHDNVMNVLPHLEEANKQFIAYAIDHTIQLPHMQKAHSTGFITYLSQYCATHVPNPEYSHADGQRFSNIPQPSFTFRPGCPPKISSTTATQAERHIDISLRHNELQKALYWKLAKKYGEQNVGTEIESGIGTNIDIVVRQGEEYWFYEIKTASSFRECIRQALGQLLEYAFWPGTQEATRLVIVGEVNLDREGMQYLHTLRERYTLPIEYEQITIATENHGGLRS